MTTTVADPRVGATFEQDYRALNQGAALRIRGEAGIILLSDADRADFLHRMTTNEINKLPVGESAVTILTSPTARSLFTFTVINRGEDLMLLPAAGRSAALAHHLHGQIFFMDAVRVTNASDQFRRLRLVGPRAGEILQTFGFGDLTGPVGLVVEHDGVTAIVETRYDLPGIELVVPREKTDDLIARLLDAGVHRLGNEAAYTVRRIELGRPLPGAEIVEAYNPLESGMGWACNEHKGCYTGQEIIARQVTYDKVTRTLVALLAEAAVERESTVLHDGKKVGTVTSVGFSTELDRHIALAIITRPHNQIGTPVTVTLPDSDKPGANAVIAALPLI